MTQENIPISQQHYAGIVKLIASTLEIVESDAQALMLQLFGACGRAKYQHLPTVTKEAVRAEAKELGISVPVAYFQQMVGALAVVSADTPTCSCGTLPIENVSGTYRLITTGACPACGALIKQSDVVTHHLDWITGRQVTADVLVNRDANPASPIPITETGLRSILAVHGDIDSALRQTGLNLVQFCHGLLHHPQYSARVSANPNLVLMAVEDPTKAGFRVNTELVFAAKQFSIWRGPADPSIPGEQKLVRDLSSLSIDKSHKSAIRQVLCQLYRDESSARRVAGDAGLRVDLITFSGQIVNTWDSALTYAFHNNMVGRILEIARSEYGTNSQLQSLLAQLSL